jgi:hypothetical protein
MEYQHPFPNDPAPVTELGDNRRIQLTIFKNSTLRADDGTPLSADVNLVFYTVATPVYASVEYIQLMGGEVVENLPEAAVYLMSFANSLLVDDMLLFDANARFPDQNSEDYKFFARGRAEFVKCKTIADLMRAILATKGTMASRRTLADFTIDLGSQDNLLGQARGYLSDAIDCYKYWQTVLFSGGAADHNLPGPKSAVKSGINANEQAGIGRGWVVNGPALNAREDVYITGGNSKSRPRRGYAGPGGYVRNPYWY